MLLVWFVHSFLKFWKIGISEVFSFLVFRRVEAEQENDQSEDDRDCAHGLFTCRKSPRRRIATSTPSNGLDTATQKKTSQPESLAVLFVFTLCSQAFEQRNFANGEISFDIG